MGERFELGGIGIDFLVEAEDSGGSVTVFECMVPAGSKVPAPHSHDAFGFDNRTDAGTKFLAIASPGVFGRRTSATCAMWLPRPRVGRRTWRRSWPSCAATG